MENPIQPGTSGEGRILPINDSVKFILYFANDYYYIFVGKIVVGIFVLLP